MTGERTEHLDDLSIFLTLLLEGEFALLVVVLVLAPTSVLASLFFMSAYRSSQTSRRHDGRVAG